MALKSNVYGMANNKLFFAILLIGFDCFVIRNNLVDIVLLQSVHLNYILLLNFVVFILFAAENKICVLAVIAVDRSLFWQGDYPLPSQEECQRLLFLLFCGHFTYKELIHTTRLRPPSNEKLCVV